MTPAAASAPSRRCPAREIRIDMLLSRWLPLRGLAQTVDTEPAGCG
jgi:hypothetical protein